MRARCSSVRNGAGASSTSFWLRRCSEQSRVPTTIDVAVGVGEHLRLDVPRLVEEALDEALAAAERRDGLADGGVEQLGDLLDGAGHLQAATAAAERGLDGDRQPVLLREGDDLVGVLDRVLGAGHQRGADLHGDVAGLHLVAEGDDRLGGGADPGQPGVEDRLGEVGVLGEEAVAGVDGVGAGLLRGVEDLLDRPGRSRRGSCRRGRTPRRRPGRAGRPGRARRRRRRWSRPSSLQARATRTAISPRLAIRTFCTGALPLVETGRTVATRR